MTRLNDRAFEILCAELRKCSGAEKLVQVQRDIVLKRLEKLRSSQGSPTSLEELRHAILDIIPDFSENALKAAARANRPHGASLSKIKWVAGIDVLSLTSSKVFLQFPDSFPRVLKPVSRVFIASSKCSTSNFTFAFTPERSHEL
jgi:hypothetical protein